MVAHYSLFPEPVIGNLTQSKQNLWCNLNVSISYGVGRGSNYWIQIKQKFCSGS